MLISEVNATTTKETLYRAFWQSESNTSSFYKLIDDERVLFRVRVRGKFLLGIGNGFILEKTFFSSTDGLELSSCGFSTISHFLEPIPIEHIE